MNNKESNGRTTHWTLFQDARAAIEGAMILYQYGAGKRVRFPLHILVARASETALKSILVKFGVKVGQVKRPPLGHDIIALISELKRFDFQIENVLSQSELHSLSLMNVYYRGKVLEYRGSGNYHLPSVETSCRIGAKLVLEASRRIETRLKDQEEVQALINEL